MLKTDEVSRLIPPLLQKTSAGRLAWVEALGNKVMAELDSGLVYLALQKDHGGNQSVRVEITDPFGTAISDFFTNEPDALMLYEAARKSAVSEKLDLINSMLRELQSK